MVYIREYYGALLYNMHNTIVTKTELKSVKITYVGVKIILVKLVWGERNALS